MPIKLDEKPQPPGPELEKDLRGDSGTLTTRSANITTLAAALKYSKVDLNEWEVERHVINSWEVTLSGHRSSTQKDSTYTNYQVKIWLRRKKPTIAETAVQQFRHLIRADLPKRYIKPPRAKGQFLYELAIFDAHLGKLAQSAETGWQNYDCKIAERDYREATDRMLSRAPQGTEEILLVFGNDQFNADNEANQTTAGTPQDCDGRFAKVFRLGVNLSIESIQKSLSIAPVRAVIVPGNHDHLTSWMLGEVLRAKFGNNPHVKIDNEPHPRKYVQYGANLIGFTHADKTSEVKLLPNLMASEMRHVWHLIRHSEWHTAHFHTRRVFEVVGMVMRTLTALCPPDKWHAAHGYVGNLQGAQAFSWHKTRGLEETFCHNILAEPIKL
jgi:hypothetical protein